MPTIRSCLEHRHSYVRRNAVMAIFTIYKNFDFLIPDAPELIATFLETEQVRASSGGNVLRSRVMDIRNSFNPMQ
jgi:vesicle coat complex subunit